MSTPSYVKSANGTDPRGSDPQVSRTVSQVIADVAERGDAAVRQYSETFDDWSPEEFRLSEDDIDRIVAGVPDQVIADIEEVQSNVRAFAQHQRDSLRDFEVEAAPGVHLGQRNILVSAAGAYAPGGRYPLVASAHMTAVTAKVAGVPYITACTPPIRGRVPAVTVAAFHLAGVDAIYLLGGVQAVAAMALGTETIRKVDMLAGPGTRTSPRPNVNYSVRSASTCSRGPPRVLIVADAAADPFIVAVDLLSQAEHGPDSPAVLITDSETLARAVAAHVDDILPGMPTKDFAEPAWRDHGQIIVVDDIEVAYALADTFASEHVQVLTVDPRRALEAMSNYGALFLGEKTCVSDGDKVIGTNHTLPTRQSARYTGELWVGKYLKTVTYQEVTSAYASARLGELCGRAARVESFEGHARSGDVRAAKFGSTQLAWMPTHATVH